MVEFSKYMMPSAKFTPVLKARQVSGQGLILNWTFKDVLREMKKKFQAASVNYIGTMPITLFIGSIIGRLISNHLFVQL